MSGILSAFGGGSYGAPPSNTVAPAVSGTATNGQTLSSTTGTWTAAPPITGYAYQWQRAGSNISGATSSTYVLVAADVGSTIRCVVTATNAISAVDANSNSTASVAAVAPGIPTGVSATATSSSVISVSFSAPASNGGASIDYYQAVCTGSGTNSATGTSPISVTGLSASTAYTFQVRAHNSIGYGSYSSSTGTATTQAVIGSVSFNCPGQYSWTVPAGVTSISVLAISGGTAGSAGAGSHLCSYDEYGRLNYCGNYFYSGQGGAGGQASWRNNVTVTPGQTLYVKVASVGQQVSYCYIGDSSYVSTSTPSQASYNNYYYNTWKNMIVGVGRYCFYTTNFPGFAGSPQSLGNVGSLTLGTPSGSSKASAGGCRTWTFRGTWFGTYYSGSGPCASKSSGGGGGGGASLVSEGSVYPWSLCLTYSRGTGGSSAAAGCPFGNTPTYNSKTGQAGSCAGGTGGNSPGTYSNGTQGYGSGALFGSSASQGSVGGISAGGGGISAQTGAITMSPNDSARGAVRIVYPGNTRSWPNTGVCYGA